jgi:hypothetical protein
VETEVFVRNALKVNAVRITPENIGDVARWMNVPVRIDPSRHGQEPFLTIVTGFVSGRPQTTPAKAGDWIGEIDGVFRKYKHNYFVSSFEPKKNVRVEISVIIENALSVNPELIHHSLEDLAENYTDQIMKVIEGK